MTDDSNPNHLNYYAALYQYIHSKGTNLMVAGNPGINTLEAYLTRPTADILVTFEVDAGYANLVVDGWVTNHLARSFCHLPYNTPSASTMTNYVTLAASRNVGWIYVTDDSGANPWDTLPAYWTNEVNYIRSFNQSAPPARLRMLGASNGVPALRISGAPGTYEVQGTSNLVTWFVVTNASTTTSQINLLDSTATNSSRRLYRTRQ